MKTILALTMLLAGVAFADTTSLPDPDVTVNPNYQNTTTIVTVWTDGVPKTYRGPSQFIYFSECVKPDLSDC